MRHHVEAMGLADRILVDSAGTHGYHVGDAPDQRSVLTARKHGIYIEGLRARKVEQEDFREFNLILALDYEHLKHLHRMAPKDATAHVDLFLEYSGNTRETEIPDPYYGDQHDFDHVLDLIESGVKPILVKFQNQLESI